jgi:transposase
MGQTTAIVNPESVHKFKVIESNDTGKTDRKDCRVIFLLAKYDKTLIDRDIQKEYTVLRHLHSQYVDLEKNYVGLRCKIYNLLEELFPDYSMSLSFLYTKSGRLLIKRFNASPYKIVKNGFSYFFKRMKNFAPRIRKTTIEKLWQDAKTSVHYQLDPCYVMVLESHFKSLWEEFFFIESRKDEVESKMEASYDQLKLSDPALPYPVKGFISKFRIAQLLAETGSLTDFKSVNQLLRYAGLNIRERQSGQYTGQNHISKKGRSNLRRVLGYIVLPLVKKKALFGSRYHAKKDNGMPGNKAMVAMMRKFLKAFYGWYNSDEPFDINRIFLDEYQYQQLKEPVEA